MNNFDWFLIRSFILILYGILVIHLYRLDKRIKYLEGNIKHIEEYLKNKTV